MTIPGLVGNLVLYVRIVCIPDGSE